MLTGKILQRTLVRGRWKPRHEHLGYEKNSNAGDNSGNSRNGHTEKTVLLENQKAVIEVPRDRNGTFEPIIVPKHEKRRTVGSIPLFNDQVISLYASGMTDRKIREHIERIYNVEVSPDMVSRITDAVIDEVSPPQAARNGKTGRWKNLMR
jgi:transposase-like protein